MRGVVLGTTVGEEESNTKADVDDGTGDEQQLEAEQRHQDQSGDQDTGDGAQGVEAIDGADCPLAADGSAIRH